MRSYKKYFTQERRGKLDARTFLGFFFKQKPKDTQYRACRYWFKRPRHR